KLAERFRQLVGDLTIEVFLGQLRQSRSQSLDGEPLALGRAFAFRGELVGALRRLLIEVTGECEIHVDQRGLDERAERRPELVPVRLPAPNQAFRPDFHDNRVHQMFYYQRITADVPPRLQSDSRMRFADRV